MTCAWKLVRVADLVVIRLSSIHFVSLEPKEKENSETEIIFLVIVQSILGIR